MQCRDSDIYIYFYLIFIVILSWLYICVHFYIFLVSCVCSTFLQYWVYSCIYSTVLTCEYECNPHMICPGARPSPVKDMMCNHETSICGLHHTPLASDIDPPPVNCTSTGRQIYFSLCIYRTNVICMSDFWYTLVSLRSCCLTVFYQH